jgi:hypothetical protein
MTSTMRSRPSVSTSGVMRVITESRMPRTRGVSSTASRYTSSISISGLPVSGEWMLPVSQ